MNLMALKTHFTNSKFPRKLSINLILVVIEATHLQGMGAQTFAQTDSLRTQAAQPNRCLQFAKRFM